jgi:glucose-1-phosphatase
MSQIKAILWDFAGVVLFTVKGSFNSLLAERLNVPLHAIEEVMNSTMNDHWDVGEIDDVTFYTYILNTLQQPMEKISIIQRFVVKDFYVDQDILARIKVLGKDYTNILLTNFPQHFHEFIKTDWIIDGAFDHVIASCDVKLIKPDPAIYQLALERAGCRPHESVFLDDREVNVRAAKSLGIHGIIFRDKDQAMLELEDLLAD